MIARELCWFASRMWPVWYLSGYVALLLGVASFVDWRAERRRRKPTWDDVKMALDQGCCVVEEDLPDGPVPAVFSMYWCTTPGCLMVHETEDGARFCYYTRELRKEAVRA